MPDSPSTVSSPSSYHESAESIAGAAGLIGAATLSSRVLGFIRDMVLAGLFGASAAADAFFVAYRIPNLLRELLAEGSMSSAFIPIFTEYHTLRTKRETWEFASAVFTTLLSLVTVITLVGIVAAPMIVWGLAPGFHDHPEKLAMTIYLTRIMFPYLLFVSLAALAMGILNSIRAFAAPALAPVFFNVSIIACALIFAPILDEPVIGAAIGVVIGGCAQFVMQLPGIQRRGLLFGWWFYPGHAGVRRIGLLILPTLLGLSVTQVNLTVSTILASFFSGGPTYLFYGMRLIQFPLGIFGVALATAILPTLSAQAARGDMQELQATFGFGLRMIGFIIFPAMVGLIMLREPIVHLFFEHGAFSAEDTQGTTIAILWYAIGLWAFAGVRIIVSVFYSMQDTRTPAFAAVGAMVVNLVLALWLMEPLGHGGLALATAIAAMVNVSILMMVLTYRLGGMEWGRIGGSLSRAGLACVPVLMVCVWIADLAVWERPEEWLLKGAILTMGIGLSIISYVTTHRLCQSEELDVYWKIVRAKWQTESK